MKEILVFLQLFQCLSDKIYIKKKKIVSQKGMEMATHSSVLAGESHGQRSLTGYSPWGCKESDMTEATSLSPYKNTGP